MTLGKKKAGVRFQWALLGCFGGRHVGNRYYHVGSVHHERVKEENNMKREDEQTNRCNGIFNQSVTR
jgi:hypothetical protein